MPQFFDGLQNVNEESFQKILVSLMDPTNIETKTEIEVPLALAQLDVMSEILKSEGVPQLHTIMQKFIKKYLVFQVSRDREGRKEIIKALTDGLKEERKLREKLTTPVGE